MALVKTDYGLEYNTDGSLCVTKRKDDVPFAEVTSYAVEEGTTNLLSGVTTTDYYGTHTQTGYSYTFTANSDNTVSHYLRFNLGSVMSSATVQLGFYLKKSTNISQIRFNLGTNDGGNTNYFWGEFVLSTATLQNISQGGVRAQVRDIGNAWFITIGSDTVDTSKANYFVDFVIPSSDANKVFTIYYVQLEHKPFATSFVDGTRPAGRWKRPLPTDYHNLVVSFWNKYPSNLDFEPHLMQLGLVGGNRYDFTYKRVFAYTASGDYMINTSYSSPGIPDVWQFWTLIVDAYDPNDTDKYKIKIYRNGVNVAETAFVEMNPDTTAFSIASLANYDYYQGYLVANLYIGNYRDDKGNIIWTDEYIDFVYKQQKPFNIPKKRALQ